MCDLFSAPPPDPISQEMRQVFAEINKYSVGLALGDPQGLEVRIIGSGTLVCWNSHYGVLTADHVVTNPEGSQYRIDFESGTQFLQLIFDERIPTCRFHTNHLLWGTLGSVRPEGFGPDLAIIKLPPGEELASLKARFSFFNLTHNTSEKLSKALNVSGLTIISGIAGHEVEYSEANENDEAQPARAYRRVAYVAARNYLIRDSHDYFEVLVRRTAENDAPTEYGGFSGGGVWRVFMPTAPNTLPELILAGVPIYEQFPDSETNLVRCHGPRTIYESLPAILP